MSVKQVTMYKIVCDNCGNDDSTEDGIQLSFNASDAEDAIVDSYWHTSDDDKHYCPSCFTIGDDDEITIKPKATL